MPAGVADRLLGDAEERRARRPRGKRSPPPMPRVSTRHLRSPQRWHGGQRVQGDDETALLEQPRPQARPSAPARRRARRAPAPARRAARLARRRRPVERRERQIDAEERRRQRLRRAIVQLTRQATPFVFADCRLALRRSSRWSSRTGVHAPPRRASPVRVAPQNETAAPRGVERRVHAGSIRTQGCTYRCSVGWHEERKAPEIVDRDAMTLVASRANRASRPLQTMLVRIPNGKQIVSGSAAPDPCAG